MHAPDQARAQFAKWEAAVRTDWYASDAHLQDLVRIHAMREPEAIASFGALAPSLDAAIRETNRDEHLPKLRRFTGLGERVEAIDFHPSYHEVGAALYGTGIMARYTEPGRERETFALLYLYAQHGEAGHACPLACTAGMIKILQRAEGDFTPQLARLTDPVYATHFHGAQWLTEVQGGSDVGANALVAEPQPDGTARLRGEKWFCSVIDAHLFLVTARPVDAKPGTAGVMAYLVPREHPEGRTNDFAVRRLKFKLGTRSMASAEVDFNGAYAIPVGDFRDTVEVVLNTSRLYNAVCSCGMMARAAKEAHHYAATRLAFGQPILAFPTIARIVARLHCEAYAARSLTFRLSAQQDALQAGHEDPLAQGAMRMLVNLNKFWTSIQGTSSVRDAIEVLGGNGAIEEFSVLPRLLRDSIVCEAWEGGHNVLCTQAWKDSQRLGLHHAMFAWLRALGGDAEALTALETTWDTLLQAPPATQLLHVRDLAERMRPLAQAASLTADLRAGATDSRLPAVLAHYQAIHAPHYDALTDPTLSERLAAVLAP